MNPRRRSRTGIALLAALLTIAILGLLTAGAIAAAGRLRDGSGLAVRDAQFVAATDYAVNTTVSTWNTKVGAMAVGASRTFAVPVPGLNIAPVVSVTRLQPALFWVVASLVASDNSQRRVNVLIRSGSVDPTALVPLLAAGDVTITPPALVMAADSASSASCGVSVGPAVVLGPTAQLTWPAVDSTPQLTTARHTAATSPTSYLYVGGSSWGQLLRSAEIVLPPSAVSVVAPTSSCDEGGASDWGDPRSGAAPPCAERVPLVMARGDLTIGGGVGQGVLLVSGHLHIAGPFIFSGLIVALGGVDSDADGVAIDGSVLSGTTGAGQAAPTRLSAHLVIMGDPCGAQRVVASALPPRQVRGRAWAELF